MTTASMSGSSSTDCGEVEARTPSGARRSRRSGSIVGHGDECGARLAQDGGQVGADGDVAEADDSDPHSGVRHERDPTAGHRGRWCSRAARDVGGNRTDPAVLIG